MTLITVILLIDILITKNVDSLICDEGPQNLSQETLQTIHILILRLYIEEGLSTDTILCESQLNVPPNRVPSSTQCTALVIILCTGVQRRRYQRSFLFEERQRLALAIER